MIHYGDITKIHGDQVPAVHVITGGSPCQDLSVAGKREGLKKKCHNYITCGFETDANSELERCPWCGSYLDLTRSGLFMEQIRIVKEMRENDRRNYAGADNADRLIRPRFMVWENVAGAFSSNSGEDFRAVLEETAKVADKDAVIPGLEGGKWSPCGCILGNGWSIAWRLHDAQYWGVPQRRKRICLLADFNGDTAGRILFELQRKTLERDTEQAIVDIGAESRSEVQSVSKGVSGDIETCGEEGKDAAADVGSGVEETGRSVVYGISAYDSNSMKSGNPHSGIYEADTSRTLDLNGGNPGCNQGGMAVVCLEGNGQRESHKGDGYKESDTMYTLNTVEQHAVCIENHPADSRVKISEDGVCQTLSGRMVTGGGNVPMVMGTYQETTGSLCASGYDKLGTQEAANDMFVVQSNWDGSQVSPTLTANNANGSQRMPDKDNFNAVIQAINGDIAGTLDASYYKGCGERQGVEREVVAMTTEMTPKIDEKDKGFSLRSRDYKDPQYVAYGLDRASYNQGQNAQYGFAVDEEKIGTQVAKGPGAVCSAVDCRNGVEDADKNGSLQSRSSNNINSNNVCRVGSVVRRLTPLECTRLQGFPDGWVDIGDWMDSNGKLHKDADSPKYKALGNSIALPFWQWMAERMMPYLPENPTMASLFDGIGGFPVVFSRVGCQPVWASEIEEFPIAVTKKRLGEE